MQQNDTVIPKLIEFQKREKFSSEAWLNRGLNPSADEVSDHLEMLFNLCANNLIDAINNNASQKTLKAILKSGLLSFKKPQYDTEEREFICSLFYELAAILNVDFADTLNSWLYGSLLSMLTKIQKVLMPENIIEIIEQPCDKCGIQLKTPVVKKEKGIPETSWIVARCNNCTELNLLSFGPEIKQTEQGNYTWIGTLHMDEYTYEQALVRLEQMKFFRK